ncbi:MAG: hypothetical protein O2U61_01285 [Candidatus Bathyarchaeota archaeon]|nr:hypothetical protein [Candidatus Bathyarchaeota archaeon]
MKKTLPFLIFAYLIMSCKNEHPKNTALDDDHVRIVYDSYGDSEDNDYDTNRTFINEGNEDGIYTATVDYYNSKTGYITTYTLEVEIEDNEIITIYFPKGGYLDQFDFWSTELDEDGYAEVETDDGRYFDVQID